MRARYGRNKGGKGCIVVVGGHEVTALLTKKGKIDMDEGGSRGHGDECYAQKRGESCAGMC